MIIEIQDIDNVVEIVEEAVNIQISEESACVLEIDADNLEVYVTDSDCTNVFINETSISIQEDVETVQVIEVGDVVVVTGNPPNIQNSYSAGENIGAYMAVKLETDGLLYLADNSVPGDIFKTIGLSISSGLTGSSIQVIEKGFKQNNILNIFSPGVVFVGSSGNLVQVKPVAGFAKKLGFIVQPGEIYVQLAQGTIQN